MFASANELIQAADFISTSTSESSSYSIVFLNDRPFDKCHSKSAPSDQSHFLSSSKTHRKSPGQQQISSFSFSQSSFGAVNHHSYLKSKMLLFKSNLLVILFVFSAVISRIQCQSNDTEITTESTIDDGNEESDEKTADVASSAAPSAAPSAQPSMTSKSEETRTQPTLTDADNIKDDDSPNANNKEDNEFTGNENDDSSLFSISPSASSAPPADKSGDSEANDDKSEGDDGASSPAPKSSTSEQPKSSTASKQNYEECVALGNENCGTPPDDAEEEKEIKDDEIHVKPSESNSNINSNKSNNSNPATSAVPSNEIDNENKSEEAQEQKAKHLW